MGKRYTVEEASVLFDGAGLVLLSTEYKNNRTPLRYRCKDNGHVSKMALREVLNGCGCLQCYLENKKPSFDFIRSFAKEQGYELLSDKYPGVSKKLLFLCPNGHHYESTWGNFYGHCTRCPLCSREKTLKDIFDKVNIGLEKRGWKLLTKECKSKQGIFEYICNRGHRGSKKWTSFREDVKCRECYFESIMPSFDEVKEYFEQEGYTLLSKEYKNNCSYLRYICQEGHLGKSTWSSFKGQGRRCWECFIDAKRNDLDYVREEFESVGYEVDVSNYTNCETKLKCFCPKGHLNYITLDSLRAGSRCNCERDFSSSAPEKEIFNYISSIVGKENSSSNDRSVISPKELDIYVPSRNLAIEYCGLYWHSDLVIEDKYYHKNKYDLCYKKGIRLITVFEDEYLADKRSVLSRLRRILSDPHKPVFTVIGDKLVSDLRWDWHRSLRHYERMGYTLSKEVPPAVFKKIRATKQKQVVYGNVWDCGKVVYKANNNRRIDYGN